MPWKPHMLYLFELWKGHDRLWQQALARVRGRR